MSTNQFKEVFKLLESTAIVGGISGAVEGYVSSTPQAYRKYNELNPRCTYFDHATYTTYYTLRGLLFGTFFGATWPISVPAYGCSKLYNHLKNYD